jgi:putative flippase GtrA
MVLGTGPIAVDGRGPTWSPLERRNTRAVHHAAIPPQAAGLPERHAVERSLWAWPSTLTQVNDCVRGRYAHAAASLVQELGKFGVVGGVAFIVDLSLFNLLHFGFDVDVLTSRTLSTAVAATLAYFGNRHWSFKHRAYTGVRREYPVFIVITVVGLAIQLAVLGLARYVWDIRGVLALNIVGVGLGTGLATIFRYLAYKRWVFLSQDRAARRSIGPAIPPTDSVPARLKGSHKHDGADHDPGVEERPGESGPTRHVP